MTTPAPPAAAPAAPPAPATPPPAGPPAPAAPAAPATLERPDGVSDAEWAALGDPGKAAIVRERARANAAEQALAAARTTPPKPEAPPPGNPPAPAAPATKPGEQPDIAAIVQQAVNAALQPLQEANAQRDAEQAAGQIRDAVTTAAAERFHDATDALAQVNLAALTDGTGRADPAKITAELDALLLRKPHLGKPVDDRRRPAPGDPVGSTLPSTAPLDDRVKATLARMQSGSGVKFADA